MQLHSYFILFGSDGKRMYLFLTQEYLKIKYLIEIIQLDFHKVYYDVIKWHFPLFISQTAQTSPIVISFFFKQKTVSATAFDDNFQIIRTTLKQSIFVSNSCTCKHIFLLKKQLEYVPFFIIFDKILNTFVIVIHTLMVQNQC